MCDDLAAADNALTLLGELPEGLRAERGAEYEGLARDLMAEIEAAMLRAKVVPLPGARQRLKK
jgi:hypothetical protein